VTGYEMCCQDRQGTFADAHIRSTVEQVYQQPWLSVDSDESYDRRLRVQQPGRSNEKWRRAAEHEQIRAVDLVDALVPTGGPTAWQERLDPESLPGVVDDGDDHVRACRTDRGGGVGRP
jgi:hypothetical protein